MSNIKYFDALKSGVPVTEIASKGGLSYIAAATAARLSGRPEFEFAEFNGQPHLPLLNGALVAVDLPIGTEGKKQRMWLAVMDRDNKALNASDMTVADINNSRQRCLVKAIACAYGAGMSLYLSCEGDGEKAVKLLGVDPDTDLSTVNPIIANLAEGGQPYIEWGAGLAVARITDPDFTWSVVEYDGVPYREVLGGLQVDVTTVYCGKSLTLSLPLMDAAFNPIPKDQATPFDWNKAVMRALTKCIAFNSGYGLGVYADEFGKDKEVSKAAAKEPRSRAATKSEKTTVAKADKDDSAASKPTGEDASKTPETSSTATEATDPAVNDAQVRFKQVMQTRVEKSGVAGLVTLVKALDISDKYAPEDKPGCYNMLLQGTAALIDAATVTPLLVELEQFGVMKHVATDAFEVVAAKLVSVAIAAGVAESDDALKAVPAALIAAGVAKDIDDVMRLGALGNTAPESLDLLHLLLDTTTA